MSLARTVSEICDRLLADDWCRFSTDDGRVFYYVVGLRAFDQDVEGSIRCSTMRMAGSPADQPKRSEPHHAWYVRSQLASAHPDYMAAARVRLRAVGITDEQMDAFTATPQGLEGWHRAPDVSPTVFLEALSEFLNAWRGSKGIFEPDAEDQEGISDARERLLLERLSRRYAAMLKRAGGLDALGFSDAQLHEAVECYLLGFYRAAILVAAAALEMQLQHRTSAPDRTPAMALVDTAESQRFLASEVAEQCRHVFRVRNRVAHDARAADQVDAEAALDHVRSAMTSLRA